MQFDSFSNHNMNMLHWPEEPIRCFQEIWTVSNGNQGISLTSQTVRTLEPIHTMSPAEDWEAYDILIIDNLGCADEKIF